MNQLSDKALLDKINGLQKDFSNLNKLFDLSKIVNQSLNLTDLSENIVTYILDYARVESAAVFIEHGEIYSIIASDNVETPAKFSFKNDSDDIWLCLFSGKPISIIQKNDELKFNSFFEKYDLHKLNPKVLLPLVFNEKLTGLILLGEKTDGSFFTEEDFIVYETLIDYITPVFNKFNIQHKKEVKLQDLHKTLHNISILYNIGQAMNFIDDLKVLLKVIIDKAIKNIDAERGSLMLYDISTNELAIKVVYGIADKEIEEKINEGLIECTRIPVGEGIGGTVFLDKTPMIANSGANDPRFTKGVKDSDILSILCVPLIVKGESIGVINITNKKNGKTFDQQDLEFMEALANQAAIAIDNAQLYELATKDGLTKLYIHRYFYTLLDTEIKRSVRYNHCMGVIMLDVDDFKSINDLYGHKMGDQVLREIAAVISHAIRKIDMAARYGGDEFAIILPETSVENAQIIAKRLRKNISEIKVKTSNGKIITPTVSLGIAEFPYHAQSGDELIEQADKSLYFAKNQGKNRVAQCSDTTCFIVNNDQ
ncbi:MAG: diguanylate cyclase [Candidatus Gastranaerophilaceae bacterium]|jgi:diguanylate cyclase (GGDEF)-like protein